ncbi:MAG: hypothetical protein NDI61_07470 [Bdellovibrionaceae bacterium]|nr:hypothetical protein [Pseudobdellovibrionaceae bacterium]
MKTMRWIFLCCTLVMALMPILMTILTSSALGAPDVSKGCEGLSAAIRSELRAPYKPVKGELSKQCVSTQFVTSKTMHLFIAAAFYHDDQASRQSAMRKLSNYKCRSKGVCEELQKLVDEHMKVTVLAKPDEWRALETEATALREEVRAKTVEE